MTKVRVGVVGVGGMGVGHCRFLSEVVPETELTAVADVDLPRAQEVGTKFGVPAFDSHEALFQSGLCDAVVIATPHIAHAPAAISAFQHGLHVFVEKPLTVTVSEADAVIEAWRSAGTKFAIGYQQRAQATNRAVRQLIEDGFLGELRRSLLITAWYRTQAYYDSGGWRATWAGEGGGVLINQAPHFLDLLLWFGGMPSTVRGFTRTRLHEIETEDEAFALLDYPNGAHGYLYATTNEEPAHTRIELVGERGSIRWVNGQVELWRLQHPIREFTYTSEDMWASIPAERVELPLPPTPEGALRDQPALLQNFARAILYDEPLWAPGEEGLMAVELINAILLSSHRAKPVTIPVDRKEYDQLMAELKAQSRPKTRVREQRLTDPKLG